MSNPLPSGALDTRVELLRPSAAVDELGAPLGFVPAGFAWARLESLGAASAGEPFAGQGRARLRASLRLPNALAPGWRVRVGSREFSVVTLNAQSAREGIGESEWVEEAP